MAQDRVGGGDVKEQVRQGEAQQERAAGEAQLVAGELQDDGAVLAALELFRLDRLQEGHGLGDPLLQFREGGFGVREAGDLDLSQARGAALGAVGGDLDLAGQGVHVGGQTPLDEHRRVDLARLGAGDGLVEDGGEVVQGPDEYRDRGFVHRQGHGDPSGQHGVGPPLLRPEAARQERRI